jgi:hypothetical protein
MTNSRYLPATHDPILTEMNNQWRRTDQEIADEMGFDRDTITTQRVRLGLPRYSRPRPTYGKAERDPPPPKDAPNPLRVAGLWLGTRLVEKPSGYWLDGVPANLDGIIRAANRLLKEAGVEQLSQNPRWRV